VNYWRVFHADMFRERPPARPASSLMRNCAQLVQKAAARNQYYIHTPGRRAINLGGFSKNAQTTYVQKPTRTKKVGTCGHRRSGTFFFPFLYTHTYVQTGPGKFSDWRVSSALFTLLNQPTAAAPNKSGGSLDFPLLCYLMRPVKTHQAEK
jgi:hypothetical protein